MPGRAGEVSEARAAPVPVVSVVIPTYDRASLLPRAIESALAQTWRDLEVLVVDDGSTDRTTEVVARYRDPRVRLVRLGTRSGASRARNVGIRAARGDWVAFLDSDDEWLAPKLEVQLARVARESQPVAVVYCLRLVRDHLTGHAWPHRVPLHEGEVFDALLVGGWTPPTSLVMARRAALLAVGGFDETLPSFQDYDLWLRLARAGHRFVAADQVLVVKHRHEGPRIGRDYGVRARGVEAMAARWGGVMRDRLGPGAERRWRRARLSALPAAQLAQLRAAVARGDRALAWAICRTIWRAPWRVRARFGGPALAVVLGGRPAYAVLARLRDALAHRVPSR